MSEQIFITELEIKNVRHLKNLPPIQLGQEEMRHLILTGKNGSGKTSVLMAIGKKIGAISKARERVFQQGSANVKDVYDAFTKEKTVYPWLNIEFDQAIIRMAVYAEYFSDRSFKSEMPKHIEKVELKEFYGVEESPREEFLKYLLDMKMTEALARGSGKIEKAESIKNWFDQLEQLLRRIFEDDSLYLDFDEETFGFHIMQKDREPFDFNTMSSGYQAILDIVLDLIMRMEKQTNRSFLFDVPGIVLIDEIETHLHLEMQKNILPMLTTIFPNIQFIVTTHSPFVLNSIPNAVIYDLENRTLVQNGLSDIPYDGIVEGYFGVNKLSAELQSKFERYKELVHKEHLEDCDFVEIAELEQYLEEIPDYLALNLTTEFQKMKLEFSNREDIDG